MDQLPADADLVVIGNPTNPTSVLHPAALLNSLRRPERLLVVDEAFMDAVPGETETMISNDLTGVVILRSLTKTWGLAGLRAGYVIGDPNLVAAMRQQQPPWSVSTPALAAMVACLTPNARQSCRRGSRGDRRPAGLPDRAAGRPGPPRRRPAECSVRAGRHQPRTRRAGNLAGSASPYGTTVSPYAAARPSPASGRTGSGLPYANPKSPTSWWRPLADLSESERAVAPSDSDKSA